MEKRVVDGAALSRFLSRENVQAAEVNQPARATRRERGKADAVDAEAAAHTVLSGRTVGAVRRRR
ncbi:hypothetical protein M271_50440 [Streptomyces rapamycinicus NRRL 5491]|uniref:Transposase n=1 Tax=Streptomyces rapamycinicus (strain ATCC 29253 / DSM 41530 / NRRL 5491 / AYB-994) TaxID=1343740 RepID=A0A0A0NXF6_STRRN|nr:hypothetical protein M271_50440 [Streptomyces rapamycinicus NRRL 5491]RLV71713.1 hypothetical protein D3C57_144340 [Streptomyces rapamycinicus NRRL 5491]